eukprot:980956-Rhodomonas_salina.1
MEGASLMGAPLEGEGACDAVNRSLRRRRVHLIPAPPPQKSLSCTWYLSHSPKSHFRALDTCPIAPKVTFVHFVPVPSPPFHRSKVTFSIPAKSLVRRCKVTVSIDPQLLFQSLQSHFFIDPKSLSRRSKVAFSSIQSHIFAALVSR